MSDKDDVPDRVKAQLEADAFVFGNGFAEKTSEGEYKRIDPKDVSLSIDSDTELRHVHRQDTPGKMEYSGSMEIKIELQDVECPQCGIENHLPTGDMLRLFSEGPINCQMCGYPLL